MLQRFYARKGQGVSGEYVLMIAFVAIAITAMTIYARRALQGRMRDASNEAVLRSSGVIGQQMQLEYEPYYVNSTSQTDASTLQEDRAMAAGGYGLVRDTARSTGVISTQLPAKAAD